MLAAVFAFALVCEVARAEADAAAREPAPEAVLATLPFEPGARPRSIVIDLAPKGNARRLPFQLDTGANTSIVSPRLAREMGVKVSRIKQDAYRRNTALGRDVLFYVDTRRSDTAGPGIVEWGLLGGDFLASYVVELDFANHQVRFLDPERYEVPAEAGSADEAVLPLKIVSNRPGMRVSIGGHEVDMLVDTGFDLGLMLSGEVARNAGVASEPVRDFQIAGVSGVVDAHAGDVARLEIGPFLFEKIPATVLPTGFFNRGFPGDSIVGYDVLARFLVRLDYPRQRIWLRRRTDAPPFYDPRRPETQTQMSWAVPPEPEDALAAQPPRDTAKRQVWLEWRTPEEAARVGGPVGFVAVEGWAGVGDPIRHDVVIAIDVSGSTLYASGADVDGDGELGKIRRRYETWRTFNPRHLSSDDGDTVLAAEVLAARRLVELLDPERTRIGLVGFSDRARIMAPLGSERARLEQVFDELDEAWGGGNTNLAEALSRGAEVLRVVDPADLPRRKTLLVLSDGWPTVPVSEKMAAERALEEARAAARDGVRIDSFGLGLAQRGEGDVYARIATVSGGRYRPLPQPAQVVQELPRIDLADVAGIEIANVTTGGAGRAVRVLPDGSFDGVVMLGPGENRIRVTARDDAGTTRSDERVVYYDARPARNADEEEAFERRVAELRRTLELRQLETELIAEIQAKRGQRRELEVHAEE